MSKHKVIWCRTNTAPLPWNKRFSRRGIGYDSGFNYHQVSCKYLAKGKIALGLEEAKEEGYIPCPVCKPPQ